MLGYIIKYRVVDCHEDRPEGCDEKQVFNITSNGSLAEIKIPNLRKYTKYSMSVQVFNSKGKGNFSKIINITTDEDSEFSICSGHAVIFLTQKLMQSFLYFASDRM